MQTIIIQDDKCWCCGKEFEKGKVIKTSHHGIPKNLKSKKNIALPVCKDCHDKINLQEINSLQAYTYKIMKTAQNLPKAVQDLIDRLNNLVVNGEVIKMKEVKE